MFRLSLIVAAMAGPSVLSPAPDAPASAEVLAALEEARVICESEGGAIWGKSLCGPLMIVDRKSRAVFANAPGSSSFLTFRGGVYVGTLPAEINIANTVTDFGGMRWSQLAWPLPSDVMTRRILIAHELFHRVQAELDLQMTDPPNPQLDTLEGRYLLLLELAALEAALKSDGAAMREATADALLFRGERYRIFADAADAERALESSEGAAEYTGVKAGVGSDAERIEYAMRNISMIREAPSFVRSFAYATGPAYGLLLDRSGTAWREDFLRGKSFDQLLQTLPSLPQRPADALAARARLYNADALRRAEEERSDHKERYVAEVKARLVDGPVLLLPLRSARYQFNPQTLQPMEGHGTIYPTIRLVDDWGILVVESGGALVGDKDARVTATGLDRDSLRGPGWTLTLNPGWAIVEGHREGDLVAAKR